MSIDWDGPEAGRVFTTAEYLQAIELFSGQAETGFLVF
jgi:hypothetical protein